MKLFSIITVCRNNLGELKQTYDSIKGLNGSDHEWIVIDGNSEDGTKEWLKQIPSAKWISEPDSGIYNAMNKGIRHASGNYLIFMNSGDCFHDADSALLAEKRLLSFSQDVTLS